MLELHKAYSRGKGEYGWLKTRYSFSFSNYRNPARMGFGALRVLNDDIVAPSRGFDMHEHENFEIVTIVLDGALQHKDSEGNEGVIRPGEVQRISAGSGISHSEFNASDSEPVALLQIWVESKEQNITPSYEQKAVQKGKNEFVRIVSGNKEKGSLYIHQDAAFALGEFDAGKTASYTSIKKGNGLFVFVISGSVTVQNEILKERDAAALTDECEVIIYANEKSVLLIIDVPMH